MKKIEKYFSIIYILGVFLIPICIVQDLIKKCTKEEIIDKSYEINFKEETLSILEGATLSFKEMKALLSTEKVLEKMYDKYMNIETNNLDNMRDIVQEIVEDIDKEFTKKREKVR